MGQSFTHANSDGDPEGESGRDDRLMLIDDAHWSRYTSEKLPPYSPSSPLICIQVRGALSGPCSE